MRILDMHTRSKRNTTRAHTVYNIYGGGILSCRNHWSRWGVGYKSAPQIQNSQGTCGSGRCKRGWERRVKYKKADTEQRRAHGSPSHRYTDPGTQEHKKKQRERRKEAEKESTHLWWPGRRERERLREERGRTHSPASRSSPAKRKRLSGPRHVPAG